MMSDDSYIERGEAATTFVGPNATHLFAAVALRSAMGLYVKTGMKVNRFYTPTAMAKAATRYTGKTYKASKAGLTQAADDLAQWIAAMKAALPVVDKD